MIDNIDSKWLISEAFGKVLSAEKEHMDVIRRVSFR